MNYALYGDGFNNYWKFKEGTLKKNPVTWMMSSGFPFGMYKDWNAIYSYKDNTISFQLQEYDDWFYGKDDWSQPYQISRPRIQAMQGARK